MVGGGVGGLKGKDCRELRHVKEKNVIPVINGTNEIICKTLRLELKKP